jgi:hypothetical protein
MTSDNDDRLGQLLAASRDDFAGNRLDAIAGLGALLGKQVVFSRLVEMLRDPIVTVRIDAAEMLTRRGGLAGLLAVLDEIGARADNPDTDYLAYKLQELEDSGEYPVLDTAGSADPSMLTPDMALGLENLKELVHPPKRQW